MNIAWVAFGAIERRGEDWFSATASTRYRVLLPRRQLMAHGHNQQYGPTMRIEFLPWSPEMTWQQLSWSDLVLLPADPADPMCATKSPNRLIEALWSGRFVVASPLPSYREFEAWAWVGGDLVAGIEWAYQHPSEIVGRIAEAQHHIEANYSPRAIGARWQQMLESALH